MDDGDDERASVLTPLVRCNSYRRFPHTLQGSEASDPAPRRHRRTTSEPVALSQLGLFPPGATAALEPHSPLPTRTTDCSGDAPQSPGRVAAARAWSTSASPWTIRPPPPPVFDKGHEVTPWLLLGRATRALQVRLRTPRVAACVLLVLLGLGALVAPRVRPRAAPARAPERVLLPSTLLPGGRFDFGSPRFPQPDGSSAPAPRGAAEAAAAAASTAAPKPPLGDAAGDSAAGAAASAGAESCLSV